MELALDEQPQIQVCMVHPAAIDTPLFQHAANYTGRAVKAPPPVYPAEQVAREIVALAENPRREVIVGNSARQYMLMKTLAPAVYERFAARSIDRQHFAEQPAPATAGNLMEPTPDPGAVSGGWMSENRAPARALAIAAAALAVPALVYLATRRNEGA